jgi:D-alanine-D-alanine ligase
MRSRLTVGVIFGSRSVEHEVSIITAQQVMQALRQANHEVVPLYITKSGLWFTGPKLLDLKAFQDFHPAGLERVTLLPEPGGGLLRHPQAGGLFRKKELLPLDVVFPVVHGTFGEDGTLQGLLELADLPYVGAGVVGSAVGMDKLLMKSIFRDHGLPVVDFLGFARSEWERQPDQLIQRIEESFAYPLFVKPCNLGSSVGISKVRSTEELRAALEVASHYDRRLMVEAAVEKALEINCAVLGSDDPIPSVCEQPIGWEEFLNYDDKYVRGNAKQGMKGAGRRIPAPIPEELTQTLQGLAVAAFRALDCRGVARVDFLVDPREQRPYVNEINTIPGSLAFYLWEATGIRFDQLVNQLIELALESHREKKKTTFSYESPLLQQWAERSP